MNNLVSEKQLLLEIKPILTSFDVELVKALLMQYRPEDIADIFWDIELDEAKFIISHVEKQKAVDIIRSNDEELQ